MAFVRKDPYGGYNFEVEIDGIKRAGFKQASGLDSTSDATKYREGNEPTLAQRQLPGLLSFSNISLQRGITEDSDIWAWRNTIASGTASPERKNISIILKDHAGNEKIRWNVRNAWPVKWSGPSFDATTDAIAIETLELAHEGIEVQKW
ncbi:MAG: phage tail protein [Polyangiaceae bacterium]|nr:phage tail protein [Polyangiaceae bacterium]NUQ72159.1 phage tail protein [Polyangiaceae bacterium]